MSDSDDWAPPDISISFAYKGPKRTRLWRQILEDPLQSPESRCNTLFICGEGKERIAWNGLAYLGSLSAMFRPRSGEEQQFTMILPDYGPTLVRKLLRLISTGETNVFVEEAQEMTTLAKNLGVSCVVGYGAVESRTFYYN